MSQLGSCLVSSMSVGSLNIAEQADLNASKGTRAAHNAAAGEENHKHEPNHSWSHCWFLLLELNSNSAASVSLKSQYLDLYSCELLNSKLRFVIFEVFVLIINGIHDIALAIIPIENYFDIVFKMASLYVYDVIFVGLCFKLPFAVCSSRERSFKICVRQIHIF